MITVLVPSSTPYKGGELGTVNTNETITMVSIKLLFLYLEL